MRFRVKEGAAYRDKAGNHHEHGALVEADEHEAAIIPWCLERSAEISEEKTEPDEKPARSKRAKQ